MKKKILPINKDFIYQIIISKDDKYKNYIVVSQYDSLCEAQDNYIKDIDTFKENNDEGYMHYGIKEIKRNE